MREIDALDDETLVRRSRERPGPEADACLNVLYRRYHRKVAGWCLRICGDRESAADLAQEVFLRVHDRKDSFRLESRFSTWLYQVARNVCINRGISERRWHAESTDTGTVPEPRDRTPDAEERLGREEIAARFRQALSRDLEPLEAQVLYLHHVDGISLAGITSMLDLRNRSGAKAYMVNGTRKLRRRFGKWLMSPSGGAAGRAP